MSTNLKALLLAAGASLAIASGAAVAQDRHQLAASAGLEPSQVEELTLTKIAAYHFNRGSSDEEQQTIRNDARVTMASRSVGASQLAHSAGLTEAEATGMTLTVIAAYHFNRGSSDEEQQTIRNDARVTMASRSAGASQLARSAGLTEAEAQNMSLRQIAAYAFNRGGPAEDWQRTDLP